MATDVVMPRLSDSMEEGTIIKWLKEEGAEVKRGDELVEIETDKANMTYEADADGTLIEVVAGEGDTLPIGEVIARLGDPSEASQNGGGGGGEAAQTDEDGGDRADEGSPDGPESESEPSHADTGAEGGVSAESASGDGGGATATAERDGGDGAHDGAGDGDGRVKASPVARRIAGERGVDLSSLSGTGPGGRIVKADVLAAADGDGAQAATEREQGAAEPAEAEQAKPDEKREQQVTQAEPAARPDVGPKGEVTIEELNRLQQTIARRMAESKATAPDFALNAEVDMTECVALRKRLKEISDPAPSFNDMIVKASAMALREHPRANGAYRDGKFELYGRVNVGIAVAAKNALIVPTIFDADHKSLGEIARDARGLATKVRDGKITPPELSGGTFAVSNLGMYGIDSFSAVINPPQAAILAVGALKKKAVVDEDGRIVARDMMSMTLVCDHRILYGADAAEFFADVKKRLEQPLLFAI